MKIKLTISNNIIFILDIILILQSYIKSQFLNLYIILIL